MDANLSRVFTCSKAHRQNTFENNDNKNETKKAG